MAFQSLHGLDLISGPWQIYARRWNGADWIVIGTGSASGNGISNTGEAWALDLGIAADGNPIVVWEDYSNGNGEVYLRHWNGTAWEEMGSGSASGGGISNDSGDSRFPTIATAANGTVYVTWFDLIVRDDGSRKRNIFVRQFVASSTCYNLTSIAIGQGSGSHRLSNQLPWLQHGPIYCRTSDQSDRRSRNWVARGWLVGHE